MLKVMTYGGVLKSKTCIALVQYKLQNCSVQKPTQKAEYSFSGEKFTMGNISVSELTIVCLQYVDHT